MNELNEKQIEANRIIDAMGGTVKVSDIFSITTGAVSQWRTDENGIPDARMFSIRLMRPDLFNPALANNPTVMEGKNHA